MQTKTDITSAAAAKQAATPMTTAQQDLFSALVSLVRDEKRFRDASAEDLEQYAAEWALEESCLGLRHAVSQSIEQRQEGAMWKFAEAMGMTFEEANAFYIANF